jgi:hypothetical protein
VRQKHFRTYFLFRFTPDHTEGSRSNPRWLYDLEQRDPQRTFFQTNFSAMEHKANIKKDMKMKEFCRVLKSVFEQVVKLE